MEIEFETSDNKQIVANAQPLYLNRTLYHMFSDLGHSDTITSIPLKDIHSDELNVIIDYCNMFYENIVLSSKQKEDFWDIFHGNDDFKLELALENNYDKWELNLMLNYPSIDLRRLIENSVFLDNSELSRVIAKMIATIIEKLRDTQNTISHLMNNPIYANMIS